MADTTEVSSNSELVAELTQRGVRQLRAVEAITQPPSLSTESLITALARHPEPRFREALIPLFLRHPTYAELVPDLVVSLGAPADTVLRHMYTAAVYLQRLWRGTLELYLGDFPLLPDYFGESDFGLPTPEEHFGEAGLRALANLFKKRTGADWLTVYQSAMSLFLGQLRLNAAYG
ncbi:MAG: hypothetical protein ACRDIB_01195 [Ardenticatenaceae bacterium]